MNSQDTNKSSEQLHREVNGQIDKIGSNIDDARAKLSPGALLDDAIFYPHGQSLTGTYSHLKANPMGSMFLSLGTLLLMEDQNHVTYEAHLRSSAGSAIDKGRDAYRDAAESISHKSAQLSEKAKDKIHQTKDQLAAKKDEFAHKAHAKKDELSQKAHAKKEELGQKAHSTKEHLSSEADRLKRESVEKFNTSPSGSGSEDLKARAGHKLDQAKESARHGLESAKSRIRNASPIGEAMHPFAIASLGLGMGATFGASFPLRKVDERLQDPRFQEKMQRLNSDFDDAIRESGERIKSHLIDELKQFNFH